MQLSKEDRELAVRALRHYAAWLRETFLHGQYRRRNAQAVVGTADRLKRLEIQAQTLATRIAAETKGSPP
jgi:hypothetical protein